jgi:hypothetical protein
MLDYGHAQLCRKFDQRPHHRLANHVVVVELYAGEAAVLDTTPCFVYRVIVVAGIYETVAKHSPRKAAHRVIDALVKLAKRVRTGGRCRARIEQQP